jgi:hypothetical protein
VVVFISALRSSGLLEFWTLEDVEVGLIAVTQVLDGDNNSQFLGEPPVYVYIMGITVV